MLQRAMSSIMAAMFVVSAVGIAMANGSSHWRWWQNPEIVQKLNLSPDDIQKVDDAYIASRRLMLEQKGRVEAEQFQLEELLSQPKMNDAAIREQHRKLEKARSSLAAERFDFLLESRKIIGYERFQKLTDIQRQWREKRKARE
jgi:Spy/CpxP family protein refolding chaperone